MTSRSLALVLLFCSTVALLTDAQDVVRFVQVVHRSGVSSPDVAVDQAAICGAAYPCGALRQEGMDQMVANGQFARDRYNEEFLVGAGNAFFPTTVYRPSAVTSRAVAIDRALQSSSAFLAGLFPSPTGFYPSIVSENATTNLVLSTDSLPPVMVKRNVDTAGLEATLQPTVDGLLSWEQLQTIATEAHYTGCTEAARGQCAVQLYELAVFYQATSNVADKPNLVASVAALTTIERAYNSYLFGYNATDALNQKQGSMGQQIAQQLLTNMRGFMSGSITQKMFEYSGKSSLIAPLAVTLGAAEADNGSALSPVYGESYFVELLQSTTPGASQAYSVRIVRGTASANAAFEALPFSIRCMRANGEVYSGANNACPFEDFARFIASSAPTENDGYCVIDQADHDLLGCPRGTRRSVELRTTCDVYRSVCPGFACGDGYVLSAVDLRCYPTETGPANEYDVVLTQLVHRHGARAPLVDFNVSEICGYEYPCGYLNGVGIDMLRSIGAYARERYNDPALVASPFFPSTRYNSSLVYTRSTSLERTLQSATSFLHALFPDSRYFFPVVYSVNMTTDYLLNTDPMPPVMLKRWENDAGLAERLNPVVDQLVSWEQLQAAAAEAFIGGTCVDQQLRWQCALDVYDVGTSFLATGHLSDKPTLAAVLPSATEVNTQYYFYVFGYNASIELDRTQGTMAQNLAQEMLGNMFAHQLAPTYKMYEYSTHDSLVAPFGVTLGDQSHATMEVPYARTYMVELLKDVGDDSYHVRVLRGYPADAAGDGNFSFVSEPFTQNCISADNETYVAENNICPLADFARLVDSTRPSVPKGYCVVNQTMYDNMDCPASILEDRPVPHYCQLYRIGCGSMACEDGYVLAQDDLQCYPDGSNNTTTTPSSTVPPAIRDDGGDRPVPVPAAKRMSEAKRRETAAGIVRGVATGVTIGAALAHHGQSPVV